MNKSSISFLPKQKLAELLKERRINTSILTIGIKITIARLL